ncbi:MAG: thiosulfate oxidation carrier complex protein SoxZ, partial [Burkholderiales bacterium]|nr:thiosulfate oxidation carrier complex protein SoxZ [Burkholderiales bacterium]
MPKTAGKGTLIEISVIAQHDMETGFRRTETGELVP